MGQPCIKSAIRAAHRKGSRLRFRHLDKATTATLASSETPAGTAAKNRGLSGRLPEPPRVARAGSGVPEAGGRSKLRRSLGDEQPTQNWGTEPSYTAPALPAARAGRGPDPCLPATPSAVVLWGERRSAIRSATKKSGTGSRAPGRLRGTHRYRGCAGLIRPSVFPRQQGCDRSPAAAPPSPRFPTMKLPAGVPSHQTPHLRCLPLRPAEWLFSVPDHVLEKHLASDPSTPTGETDAPEDHRVCVPRRVPLQGHLTGLLQGPCSAAQAGRYASVKVASWMTAPLRVAACCFADKLPLEQANDGARPPSLQALDCARSGPSQRLSRHGWARDAAGVDRAFADLQAAASRFTWQRHEAQGTPRSSRSARARAARVAARAASASW
ncbi:g278 [Coccomyxa elongata]